MNLKDLISEADYAAQRGVTVRTIQRERAQRTGPSFIKMGRKIFYRPIAIESWILGKEQEQPRAFKDCQSVRQSRKGGAV